MSDTTRVALVTGASRGIGAATALLAARQGWAVAVNYARNADAAQAVVRRIRQAGGTAIAVQGDVAVEADVVAMFAAVDEQLGHAGRLGALVNNAGVVDPAAWTRDGAASACAACSTSTCWAASTAPARPCAA